MTRARGLAEPAAAADAAGAGFFLAAARQSRKRSAWTLD